MLRTFAKKSILNVAYMMSVLPLNLIEKELNVYGSTIEFLYPRILSVLCWQFVGQKFHPLQRLYYCLFIQIKARRGGKRKHDSFHSAADHFAAHEFKASSV
jgi:hypothetical protein